MSCGYYFPCPTPASRLLEEQGFPVTYTQQHTMRIYDEATLDIQRIIERMDESGIKPRLAIVGAGVVGAAAAKQLESIGISVSYADSHLIGRYEGMRIYDDYKPSPEYAKERSERDEYERLRRSKKPADMARARQLQKKYRL